MVVFQKISNLMVPTLLFIGQFNPKMSSKYVVPLNCRSKKIFFGLNWSIKSRVGAIRSQILAKFHGKWILLGKIKNSLSSEKISLNPENSFCAKNPTKNLLKKPGTTLDIWGEPGFFSYASIDLTIQT